MAKSSAGGKLYYSISEVSRMTGLEPYVLRYWEKEFDILRPKKNRGGNRTYTQKDIDIVNRINYLRKKEKLTIAGTRTKLKMKKTTADKTAVLSSAKTKTLIGQIRKDIQDLIEDFS
ncbi:MAG: MerR family transcriptional regulator [Candidatus Zixiibacteriota bacterium]|nr:MAG: MerR family transcriptional regulator [candidate division Zixibacteria bacterium]